MVAIDFIVNAVAGTVGGVAGVYVGSPLDVIKTRMQTGALGSVGLLASLQTTVKNHGLRSLFRGSVVSAAGQIPNNFITFGAYGATLSWLTARRNRGGGGDGSAAAPPPSPLPALADVYIAGSAAGFLQTLALTPCELIKVQQQMFRSGTDGRQLGMMETARSIVSTHGVRGLYTGWVSTVARDAGTYGIYFGLYDVLRRKLGTVNPVTGDVAAPAWALLLSGGVAGAASWLLALPVDTVKSIIQAEPLEADARARPAAPRLTMTSVSAQIFASQGYAGFFRGLLPCLVRALPVNAVTFFVYESALERCEAVVVELDWAQTGPAGRSGKGGATPSSTLHVGHPHGTLPPSGPHRE